MVVKNKVAGEPQIYNKILDALEGNGELDQDEVNRLVLFALYDLGNGREDAKVCRESIQAVDKRVKKIERYSILFIASKHPKAAIAIGLVFVVFTAIVVGHLQLWDWALAVINEYTGVPLP